jgi:hypothetical protein
MIYDASPREKFVPGFEKFKKVEIVTDIYIIFTRFGYQPAVTVKVDTEAIEYTMYIGAGSLSKELEKLRGANKGMLCGLIFNIKKENETKMAKYIVEAL